MASHTLGGQSKKLRHRIRNIKLEPSTSRCDISLKILVDGQEPLRLAPIKGGSSLAWKSALSCDVDPGSRVELRVYEERFFGRKRVGVLQYTVAAMADRAEASLEFDTKQFKAVLSFSNLTEASQAPATALAEDQATEKKIRPLERLGATRDAFKTILDFGAAVAELHPAAKAAFGICNTAWKMLEKQEECDASVERLVVGLASMLPLVQRVETAARMPQLRDTVEAMMNLIEDVSRFVVGHGPDGGAVEILRAVMGSKAQDQVEDVLESFLTLKENLDRGVGFQTLEAVGAVHRAMDTVHGFLLTDAQHAFLNELKPVGSARYDSARACLPGTRTDIIAGIVDWCQQQGASEGLLWVYGQAGLGKSSIATSVCQELDERDLLAAEFFCKRDSSERRGPQRILTTIIYGMACRHPGYAKCVADTIQGDFRLCNSPIQMQYEALVKSPLESLSKPVPAANLVLVVDALDECGTTESRRQLLAYLHQMSKLVPWLKVVVTSRPDPDIQLFFDSGSGTGTARRNVYEYDASHDIASYIQHRMDSSPSSKHLASDATDLLTKRADGLFIWAKTACELILGSLSPKSRFETVTAGTSVGQTSSPLDTLYTIAIEISLGGGAEEARFVQECLGAIIVCSTREPLSVGSLSNLLGDQMESGVLETVVDRLGSVLYVDNTKGGAVRVYHHSFTDFITSPARSGRFCVDLEQQNTEFARCCLHTMMDELRFNICDLETSHVLNSEVSDLSARIDAQISVHLRYSCLYWISHLVRSKEGELVDMLKVFLLQPTVLFWIEVMSLLEKLDLAMFSALELSKRSQGLKELDHFARDAYRFILAFYDPISKSTPHLYVSALAFCSTHTAFKRRLRSRFQNTLVVTRGTERNWLPWLRCISHPEGVSTIAISKDGRRIVSGSYDCTVQMWDADTGASLGNPLVGHSRAVTSVGLSPDGRRIVSSSYDTTVRVWDADTGAPLGNPLVGHSDAVTSVDFSPDGRRIVSGSDDKTVRVWDVDTGAPLGNPLVEHSDAVTSVDFSPDGRRIVSGSKDKTVRVWDSDTGAPLGNPLIGHSDTVTSVNFSPDGRRIVSGSDDATVRVWDADTCAPRGNPLVGHSDTVTSVGFSPDGRRIVSGSDDMTVRVWDADTGALLGNPLVGHSYKVMSVGFSPDGRRVISGSDDKTVRVWDADTGALLGDPLVGHSGVVNSVGFSHDGRRIVSGSDDCTVRVWDAETGTPLGSPLLGHSGHVRSVGFSTDGRRIVSGSYDTTVRVWDADTGALLGDPLVGHSGVVNSVGFSPDGRRVISGSDDKTVRVWDADTGALLGDPLVGHSGVVNSVGFSHDGRRIVSGSDDCTVRVWDADTGAPLGNPLIGHSDTVTSVNFSPDGRRIVSGSDDATVRVWDADTCAPRGNPLVGHPDTVTSVGFSPDSRRIVSGSDDMTVRVWDADTGAPLGSPLIGHSHFVTSVGFSHDGRRIVSGSYDHTLRVWNPSPTTSTALPSNTSRMSECLLRDDGWIPESNTQSLMIWLPESYRRQEVDDSLFVISACPMPQPVTIDYSRFVHGPHWESIYTP